MSLTRSRWRMRESRQSCQSSKADGLHYIGKGEAARTSSTQMAKSPILTPKDAGFRTQFSRVPKLVVWLREQFRNRTGSRTVGAIALIRSNWEMVLPRKRDAWSHARDRRNKAPEPTTWVLVSGDARNGSAGANRNLHGEILTGVYLFGMSSIK